MFPLTSRNENVVARIRSAAVFAWLHPALRLTYKSVPLKLLIKLH